MVRYLRRITVIFILMGLISLTIIQSCSVSRQTSQYKYNVTVYTRGCTGTIETCWVLSLPIKHYYEPIVVDFLEGDFPEIIVSSNDTIFVINMSGFLIDNYTFGCEIADIIKLYNTNDTMVFLKNGTVLCLHDGLIDVLGNLNYFPIVSTVSFNFTSSVVATMLSNMTFILMNETLQSVVRIRLEENISSNLCIFYLNNSPYIAFALENGTLLAISATGDIVWRNRLHQTISYILSVDMERDSFDELIVAGGNIVYTIDGQDGRILKDIYIGDNVSSVVVYDRDMDARYDILVATSNDIRIFESSGNNYTLNFYGYPNHILLADVDGDILNELIIDRVSEVLEYYPRSKLSINQEFSDDISLAYEFEAPCQQVVIYEHEEIGVFMITITELGKLYFIKINTTATNSYWLGDYGGQETGRQSSIHSIDKDYDMLSNSYEATSNYDASNYDMDGDTIWDCWELYYGLDPLNNSDAVMDLDMDGLNNSLEYKYNTDPTNPDTDGDGINDRLELIYLLNPRNASDASQDPDNDRLSNYYEVMNLLDPWNNDTDGDGIPDGWEVQHHLDPKNSSDANLDYDGDGLTNLEEYRLGLDIWKVDTDGDIIPDGWELQNGLDPLDPNDAYRDMDNDGLINKFEYLLGTNISDPDTDDDGYLDGVEYNSHTDLLDPESHPIAKENASLADIILRYYYLIATISIGSFSFIIYRFLYFLGIIGRIKKIRDYKA